MEKKMPKPEITYIELSMTDVIAVSDGSMQMMMGGNEEYGYKTGIDFEDPLKTK